MKQIAQLLSIIIFGVICIFAGHYLFPNENIIINTKVVKEYKVIERTKYLDTPKPYFVEYPSDTTKIYIPDDCSELVDIYKSLWKEYHTRKFYTDTLNFDSLGVVKVNSQVYKNNLDSLQWVSNLKIPTTTITNTVTPKHQFFIGAQFGKSNISPTIVYTNKGVTNYTVSYNLVKSEINVGVLININKLKLWQSTR